MWEEERRQHQQELNEKTLKDIKDNIEKKLAGQHKLSKREEQIYDALKGYFSVICYLYFVLCLLLDRKEGT